MQRGGSVFGPHAGTMPFSLAAAGKGKKFVSIESDNMCFNIAVEFIATIPRSVEGRSKLVREAAIDT